MGASVARDRDNVIGTRDIRRISPLTWFFERLFYGAQRLSPAYYLLGSRITAQLDLPDAEMERIAKLRGRQIEYYMLVWLVVNLTLLGVAPALCGRWRLLVLLPAWRVLDILQSAANLNVFDQMRLGRRVHYVASIPRTLILSMWNFGELILCFGIVYSSALGHFFLANHEVWNGLGRADALYFAVATQLTIGYGDIAPLGTTRLLAALQGLLGFTFGLFVLSRMVAFLPATRPLFDEGPGPQ